MGNSDNWLSKLKRGTERKGGGPKPSNLSYLTVGCYSKEELAILKVVGLLVIFFYFFIFLFFFFFFFLVHKFYFLRKLL